MEDFIAGANWQKEQMYSDEELGLHNYGWCKGNVILPKEEGTFENTSKRMYSQEEVIALNLKYMQEIGKPDSNWVTFKDWFEKFICNNQK